VPCRPCPHIGKKGEVAHPDGVRQLRIVNSAWTTREDAEKALAARQLGLVEDQAKATAAMTFGAAIEQYLKTKARKKSLEFDKLYLTQFKAVFGADTPLIDITAARISVWKADKLTIPNPRTKKPYAAASVNRPLAALRHLLQLAHEEWGVLPAIPKIRLEREPQGRIRWLEPGEEARLLAACAKSRNPELTKIVTVALETGLRRGELLGLTWDRVDLSRGVIRLEQTKSGRRREVPMRQAVYDVLAGLPGPREGRVFETRSIRTAFENAVVEAKLDDFRLHDTRHHFASWFVMRGGSLQALKEILGHSSLTMTMRYAHLAPEHLRSEVAKTERRPINPAVSTKSAQSSESDAKGLEGVSVTS
jgi:integrase